MTVITIWDGGSIHQVRAFAKWQDKRFRRAVIDAHPQFAPAKPKRRHSRPHIQYVPPTRHFTWREVVDQVADKHALRAADIIGRSRGIKVVLARNEVCWRLRFEESMSTPAIARRLDNRDHTTILHSARRHAEIMKVQSV